MDKAEQKHFKFVVLVCLSVRDETQLCNTEYALYDQAVS